MKRLISYKDQNLDTREQVLMTTPIYRTLGEENEFTESDEKSYQRMMNEPVFEKMEQEEREKHMGKSKGSRLRKIALMPTEMFQSQLDQISDKGRDVLKAIEEYKFFVEQTSRVMKNDPALTEVIIGKKKNLEEASTKIYDVVFDIENLDIAALYEKQQQEIAEQGAPQNPEQGEQAPGAEDMKLPDGPQAEQPAEPSQPAPTPAPQPPAPAEKEEPKEEPKDDTPSPGHPKKDAPKSRLKQKSEDDEDESKEDKKDSDKGKDEDQSDDKDSKDDSKDKKEDK